MPSNRFDRNHRSIRRRRIRVKVNGTAERPRLSVFRSNKHMYGQIIDDSTGTTIVSASSSEKEFSKLKTSGKLNIAEIVGNELGKRAIKIGISRLVFDRGGYKYHGRVKKLAEGVRSNELDF